MAFHADHFTRDPWGAPREMTPFVPLWAVGAVLIVVGPWAVNRIAQAFSKKVDARTEEAIAAMNPGPRRGSASTSDAEQSRNDGS